MAVVFSAVMQYGGNVLAVGGFSFFGGNDFGGNDFGGRQYFQNMAVKRHITGTAHEGGNFTAGKIRLDHPENFSVYLSKTA